MYNSDNILLTATDETGQTRYYQMEDRYSVLDVFDVVRRVVVAPEDHTSAAAHYPDIIAEWSMYTIIKSVV